MLLWDEQFCKLLKTLRLSTDEYGRYVDDTLSIMKAIKPGFYFNSTTTSMEFDKSNIYTELKSDERTMRILTDIANTITPEIQMEPDFPSNHPEGKMPCLDIKVWLDSDIINHLHLHYHGI